MTSRARLWVTAAGLLLAATLAYALRDNLTSNELDTLQTARRWLDAGYVPGDWFLGTDQGPRRPFQVLLSPLLATLPMVWVSVVGRVLGFAALAWATARLALRVGAAPWLTWLAALLFVGSGQGVVGGEWLVGQVESKVAAYAFILVGLQAWLDERPVVAGACLGLATSLHVLVGGQASLALTLAWLVERPWRSPRPALRAASAWLVGALPALVLVWSASRTVVQSDPPMSWIYVVFRVPHHADPNSWAWTWRLLLWLVMLVGVLGWSLRRDDARPERQRLARFGLLALVPCALGLLAAVLPDGHRYLQFLPFRVGALVLPLVALLLGAAWASDATASWSLPRHRTVLGLTGLTLVACAGWSLPRQLAQLLQLPEGGRPMHAGDTAADLATLARWLRDHGPPGGVLASPAHDSVGYLSQRPVVATYTQVPPNHTDVVHWYHRIVDLAGGTTPSERGSALLPVLDARFERLPPAQVQELARRYGMRILLARRTDLAWAPLHQQGVWTAWVIPEEP